MRRILLGMGLVVGAGSASVALLGAGPLVAPSAAASSATVYVSPTPAPGGFDTSCATAGFTDINAAIAAVPAGGTVVVCHGTYDTSVNITKRIVLQGDHRPVIDAHGQPYGIGIGASYSVVRGFVVEHADNTANNSPADGIVTATFSGGQPTAADHVEIRNDFTHDNVGAGIDLNSTAYSLAANNRSKFNGIGINISDDLGRSAHDDRVMGNIANNNPGGCGIVLAEHSGAGIHDNLVQGNKANANGLGTPSAPNASSGSGVILAAGGPSGSVKDNTIRLNQFDQNGHAGIVLHGHVAGPDFSGNQLLENSIGTNNLRTDTGDTSTTGIYLGSVPEVSIVVDGNSIHDDEIGVYTAGPVTISGKKTNNFTNVGRPFVHVKTYG